MKLLKIALALFVMAGIIPRLSAATILTVHATGSTAEQWSGQDFTFSDADLKVNNFSSKAWGVEVEWYDPSQPYVSASITMGSTSSLHTGQYDNVKLPDGFRSYEPNNMTVVLGFYGPYITDGYFNIEQITYNQNNKMTSVDASYWVQTPDGSTVSGYLRINSDNPIPNSLPVPEPSAALLSLLAAPAFFFRRR